MTAQLVLFTTSIIYVQEVGLLKFLKVKCSPFENEISISSSCVNQPWTEECTTSTYMHIPLEK